MNDGQKAAVRRAADDFVESVQRSAAGVIGPAKQSVMEMAEAANDVAIRFIAGAIDGHAAAADMKKLADDTASRLADVGYHVKAEHVAVAGEVFGVALRLAQALISVT